MNIRFLLPVMLIPFQIFAGDPPISVPDSLRPWIISCNNTLNFNQTHLSNWAEGGESSYSGTAFISFQAGLDRGKYSVDHQLDLAYGMLRTASKKIRKTDDKIDYTSTFSYKAIRSWNYSTLINFKSQFSNGYKYPNDSTVVSTFMAPAYLTLSLGMQYKPTKTFVFFISPASGRFTLVLDDVLANAGAFGVTKAVYDSDSTHSIIKPGRHIKPEFGINLNIQYKKKIVENVKIESRLVLYNNYFDEDPSNRWNIDINAETNFVFTINKYLTSNIRMNLIYDHDTTITDYVWEENEKVKTGEGPRTQFKETFGIGINYKIQ
ncbi:MAG: DUF3078 domain-containing protein [Bacteroidales bacterium]|nr:DUF3078 domain-containing protein [Bacteroidales bacterium]